MTDAVEDTLYLCYAMLQFCDSFPVSIFVIVARITTLLHITIMSGKSVLF